VVDPVPPTFVMVKPTGVARDGNPSRFLCSVDLITDVIQSIIPAFRFNSQAISDLVQTIMATHSLNLMGAGFLISLALSNLESVCKGSAQLMAGEVSFYRIFYPDHDLSDQSARAIAIRENNSGWIHLHTIKCGHSGSSSMECVACVETVNQLKVDFRVAVALMVPCVSIGGEHDNLIHAPGNVEEVADQWRYLVRRLAASGAVYRSED
jgi:hypothetical protein